MRNIAFFVALLATGIALGPALAHLFELPNKIDLGVHDYFTVQQAYRGWDQLGFVLAIELGALVWLAVLYWRQPPVRTPLLGAIGCLVVAQAVFWGFTFPANEATSNWTVIPSNWQPLRLRWEYSHAAGALFQLLVMVSLTGAVLSRNRSA